MTHAAKLYLRADVKKIYPKALLIFYNHIGKQRGESILKSNYLQSQIKLIEVLDNEYTVAQLKLKADFCNIQGLNRKLDLMNAIEKYIKTNLLTIYESLDAISKLAVQETVYNYGGRFNLEKFEAKYGDYPKTETDTRGYRKISHREFILYGGVIPIDLQEALKEKIPKPEAFKIKSVKELEDKIELTHKRWDGSKTKETKKITIRETEIEALHNIQTVLALVQSGKIKGSSTTGNISEASQEIIHKHLYNGDYYSEKEIAKNDLGMLSFSLTLILLSANMVKYNGSKLELSTKGIKWQSAKPEDILKECWERWLVSSCDEFNRINLIKGQKSGLAKNAKDRRNAIVKAINRLPAYEWVSISELSSSMKINNNKFYVSNELWNLYIEEKEYGSLGYDGFGTWEIVEERYMLVFLFEYAAALGILDISYVPPENARDDFRGNWGVDDLDYLSRYDGLIHIRVNHLGEYILGATGKYEQKVIESETSLKLLTNLDIVITKQLNQVDHLFLESIAKKTADHVYKLNEALVLTVLEKGRTSTSILDFLKQRTDIEIPNTFLDFFDKISRKTGIFKNLGHGKLLQVIDRPTALLLANEKKLQCR